MKPPSNIPAVHSHDWVRFHSPNASSWWASIHRLLSEIPKDDRPDLARRLKSGQPVIIQTAEIYMQWQPMADEERERLNRLLAFEKGGFYLSTFERDKALFYHPLHVGREWYSMNEMAERGFIPKSTITTNPHNQPVTTFDGHLLDIFVPVRHATENFTYCAGSYN